MAATLATLPLALHTPFLPLQGARQQQGRSCHSHSQVLKAPSALRWKESDPASSRSVQQMRRQKKQCHLTVSMTAVVGSEAKTSVKNLISKEVELPQLKLDGPLRQLLSPNGFKRLEGIPEIQTHKRAATALLLYSPTIASKKLSDVPAVIFGHGFSQPPENYRSTLERFAQEGWVVIAPTTYLGVKEMLFDKVPGAGFLAKAPAKLQTALLTDLIRSAQFLFTDFQSTARVGKVFLCGHSMGSGCSLAVASYFKDSLVAGVGVMAPAVKGMLTSDLNPCLAMDGRRKSYQRVSKYFADDFPTSPLFIVGGCDDQIVKPDETAALFLAAFSAKEDKKLDDVTLFSMEGSHIGFEDQLNADVTRKLTIVDKVLFPIINLLVYQLELFKPITKDVSVQKALAQELLVSNFRGLLDGRDPVSPEAAARDIAEELGLGRQFQIGEVKGVKDVDKLGAAVVKLSDDLRDCDIKDQVNVSPVPGTLAVASYAVAHTLTALTCFQLFSESPSWGLAGLGGLAAGLIYENVTLGIGNLFGMVDDGEFEPADAGRNLKLLNAPRFFLHSFSPLLALTALDLAGRAGIDWASSGPVLGGASTLVALVVAVSALRNTLLLETRPKYSAGLLHFTYDDPGLDFTRIIPAIFTSLACVALGVLSVKENAALLPFAVGPAVSFLLAAIPSNKEPGSLQTTVILGNLGEVILVGSLAYTEYLLRSQGL